MNQRLNSEQMVADQQNRNPGESYFEQFCAYVGDAAFPCVGAKSALNHGRLEYGVYEGLGDYRDVQLLRDQLEDFSNRHATPGNQPVSYVAMFKGVVADENEFHDRLWNHLQALHNVDAKNSAWDASVSSNPENAHFSFSIAGRAFFVVGLHPSSSRLARRAPFPCLVFNFHDQFKAMRANGMYGKLQTAIRKRDVALQGDVNPAVAQFGESSEALQYSGRRPTAAGRCPFSVRH